MPQGAARAFQNEEYFYDDHSTNQLVPAKANVRKTGAKDGIEELAASIAAHGLLTSLDVRKASRGKYTVIAAQSFANRAEMSIAEALKSLVRPIRKMAMGALTIAIRTGRPAGADGMPIARRIASCQSVSRASP